MMNNKIEITLKQKEQFNKMRNTLIRIAKGYQSTDQLRRSSEKRMFGLDYEEALEMSYQNIQLEAKIGIKGIKAL